MVSGGLTPQSALARADMQTQAGKQTDRDAHRHRDAHRTLDEASHSGNRWAGLPSHGNWHFTQHRNHMFTIYMS